MLQVALSVNGVLIDFVDIVRITTVTYPESEAFAYSVTRRTTDQTAIVIHKHEEGAMKLAERALAALNEKEAK